MIKVGRPSAFLIGARLFNAGWNAGAAIKHNRCCVYCFFACSGVVQTGTPRASSTSLLPLRLETALLPCLIISTPPAARTKVAAVEMLKVFTPLRLLSPPVPQISMALLPSRSSGTAKDKRYCAQSANMLPVISSCVTDCSASLLSSVAMLSLQSNVIKEVQFLEELFIIFSSLSCA